MRYLTLIGLVYIIILTACDTEEENCTYDILFKNADSRLFISYEIDGEKYKYYQSETGTGQVLNLMEFDDSKDLYLYIRRVGFDDFNRDYSDNYELRKDYFAFSNYSIIDKVDPIDIDFELSNDIKSNYSYLNPPSDTELSDTIFMTGIVFNSQINNLSTSSVMDYFNYDINSINDFYSDESYFIINSIVQVCDYYFIVKGNFSVKIISNYEPLEIKYIRNGEFSFLIQ